MGSTKQARSVCSCLLGCTALSDSHLETGSTWKGKEYHWDHQLCSVHGHAGALYGSAYLPAERPIGACSLWRTLLGPGRPSHCASVSAQVPGSNKVTVAINFQNSRHESSKKLTLASVANRRSLASGYIA